MYSKQELNADSNYVIYTAFINAIATLEPGRHHFFIEFPDSTSGFKYEDDGFFHRRDVTRIPARVSTRKKANSISYNMEWHDALQKRIAFDVIWTNLVEAATHLPFVGENAFEKAAKPPTIAAHNYVIHETLPYPVHGMENILTQQLLGGLMADWNVFNSDHCRNMFFDNAHKYLSKDAIKRIEAQSSKINYGMIEPDLPMSEHGEEVVIAYNHRLQGYKQYKITFKILNDLYESGLKFKLLYMNNTSENVAGISHYPWVEIKLCRNRKEYLTNLQRCHLNVTNSVHETFCISGIESMAMGQPFVAPRGVTFPEITGSSGNSYPYLFTSEDEQSGMLRELITNKANRAKWGAIASEHVRGSYGQALWATRYLELFRKLRERCILGTPEDAKEAAAGAGEKGLGLVEYYRRLHGLSVGGRQPFGSQSCTMVKAMMLARDAGFKIKWKGKKQVLL